MLPPLPLPALAPPPVPLPVGGGVGVAAPPRLVFETAFVGARAKPAAPFSIRVSPYVKYSRPKLTVASKRIPAPASASGSKASAVIHPVPKG